MVELKLFGVEPRESSMVREKSLPLLARTPALKRDPKPTDSRMMTIIPLWACLFRGESGSKSCYLRFQGPDKNPERSSPQTPACEVDISSCGFSSGHHLFHFRGSTLHSQTENSAQGLVLSFLFSADTRHHRSP